MFGNETSNERPTPGTTRERVKHVSKKIENGKAPGPAEVPIESCKSLCEEGEVLPRSL